MNNLLMGRLSNLQPAVPDAYLDLNFSSGNIPPGFVYSRLGNHGVWSKEGQYSVVGPNVPPITWVPELNSYALAQEPSVVLKNRLYPDSTHFWLRMLGYPVSADKDIPALQAATTMTDAPDGTMTALRINGPRTAGMGPALTLPASGTAVRSKFFIRAIPGVSPSNFLVMYRNNKTDTNFPIISVNINTLAVSNPDTAGQYLRVTRRRNGWLEVDSARAAGISAGDSVGIYFPTTSVAPVQWDLWRANISDGNFISSYVEPGTSATYAARAPFNSLTPFVIPLSAGNQFDVYFEGLVASHPWAIPDGSIPWSIRLADARSRCSLLVSVAAHHSVRHMGPEGAETSVTARADAGPFGGGVRRVKAGFRSSNVTAYASPSGGAPVPKETFADMKNAPENAGVKLGQYQPNLVSAYLTRAAIMPLGSISDPLGKLQQATGR